MKLQKKVDELEKRIKRLELVNSEEARRCGNLEESRKKRRKFAELERDFKVFLG